MIKKAYLYNEYSLGEKVEIEEKIENENETKKRINERHKKIIKKKMEEKNKIMLEEKEEIKEPIIRKSRYELVCRRLEKKLNE